MSWTTSFILAFSILNLAKTNAQKLEKPGLLDNFDAFDHALKNSLPKTNHSRIDLWSPGWILEDCKTLTEHENFSSSDIETISVLYDDCRSPWVNPYPSSHTNPPKKPRSHSLFVSQHRH